MFAGTAGAALIDLSTMDIIANTKGKSKGF
jgi:hypothetical protein